MKSDYPFPDKCEKCIHNDVCYMVGECLNHVPDFECDCFEEKRPNGEWINVNGDGSIMKCSRCGEEVCCKGNNFCPNCGASMVSLNSEIEKSKSEICPCIECCKIDNSEQCRKGCSEYQKWKEGDRNDGQ